MTLAEQLANVGARHIELIVIGGSAGGVDALIRLLPQLPSSLQAAVVCILHIPGDRESHLPELFAERLVLPVREACDKESIAPGTVYFAGAGYHLSIERDRTFSLSGEALVNFSRPSIDVLMESAADSYGAALAGILLTGANADGAQGMHAIHANGGLTIVQDPLDAQQETMPTEAIRRCQPHLVLPLRAIGELLPLLEAP